MLRRALGVAGVTAVVLAGSPLVGTAFAAAPAQQSVTPADGGTATSNRPDIVATYDVALNHTLSTIQLLDGNTSVACSGIATADNAIGCKPDNSLVDKQVYTVKVHAVNAADGTSSDTTTTFTEDIPSVLASTPNDQGVTGPISSVKVTYDEAISTAQGTYSFAVRPVVNGTPGNAIAGTAAFSRSTGSTVLPNQSDTITWTYSAPVNQPNTLADGSYVATVGVQADGNANATSTDLIHFVVDSIAPPVPTNVSAPEWINSQNETAVPFSGQGPAGFKVTVSVYDPTSAAPQVGYLRQVSATSPLLSCGSDTCPWSVTLDVSNNAMFPDGGNYQWSASTVDTAGNSSSTGGAIYRDTTAPAPVSVNYAGFADSSAPNTLYVRGSISPTGTADTHDLVVVVDDTDPATAPVTTATSSCDSENDSVASTSYSIPVDVSSLVDGALTVNVYAEDAACNRSTGTQPVSGAPTKESVTLGLDPNTAASTYPVDGSTVREPDSLTVHFNEPIRDVVYDDTSQPPGAEWHRSALCLLDESNNCVATGGSITADQRGITLPLPAGLLDGDYALVGTAVAATCTNKTPVNDTCETYSSVNPITTFTIDNTPPAAPTDLAVTPSPIDASNAGAVTVSGLAEPGTSLAMSVSSSGGGTIFVPDTTADQDGAFSFDNVNVSSLADGVLSFRVTSADAVGNRSAATTATAVKSIRPSAPRNVSASAGDGYANVSWQAPTSTGGSAITSYTVTASNGATQTVRNATSTVFFGLTDGTAYSFTVSANTVAAPSGNASATSNGVTPRALVNISMHVATGRIVYGQIDTMFGTLARALTGERLAGRTISVYGTLDNGHTVLLGRPTTESDGRWGIRLHPGRNVNVFAVYGGDSANQSATSGRVRVLVSPAVTAKPSGSSTSAGSVLTISGGVSPSFAGRYVQLWAYSGRNHRTLQQVRLDRYSRYAFRIRLPRGTWTLRVVIPNPPLNTTGASGFMTLRRT